MRKLSTRLDTRPSVLSYFFNNMCQKYLDQEDIYQPQPMYLSRIVSDDRSTDK